MQLLSMSPRNLATAFVCALSFTIIQVSIGQEEPVRKPQGSSRVKPLLVPFFQIDKVAGFKTFRADKATFIEMTGLVAQLPPNTVAGQKKSANATYLQYGYKKGGIGVVYQMVKQPGMSAQATFRALLDQRIFKDREYFKEFSLKGIPDSKFLVAVSGTTPQVRDALIKAIGK
jgi:hypothetical protein